MVSSSGLESGRRNCHDSCAMQPVVHHVELCVADWEACLKALRSYGFTLFAKRITPFCQQWAARLGKIIFVLTQRQADYVNHSIWNERTVRAEPLTVMCCEDQETHRVDTVVNVSLAVRNVSAVTERIKANGGSVIQPATKIEDQTGDISFSIVRSIVGDVVHTLINVDNYKGVFLPGFEPVESSYDSELHVDLNNSVTHIDHVTLAVTPGNSQEVISFYESCFGMERFAISSSDDIDDGLILEDSIGLRLKAMEYFRCSELGLTYPASSRNRQRNKNSVMLVVVESLPGQTNCNVETFLREHEGPGVEHIAFSCNNMMETVEKMISLGVNFRKPPTAYYNELKKQRQIQEIGEDLNTLEKLGILLDNEVEPMFAEDDCSKYLMQMFAHPLFSRKTFFIEIIKRSGARGLGSGNVIALVKSIREEEKRKAAEKKKASLNQEELTSPRRLY
ncbi:4-hydroxyphenylpyruvate dioxygenase-like protein [Uloborus diversus]|uniref:4-hydroxyphenylpyruvate dioxygenase-like protein n=1 Tax=Uloborus diversus TaxID=327109 RepID=UPI00240A3693|nr:4-hydroxyphenylpyruvate dioxygenase-like protein [Uloborus diversus]